MENYITGIRDFEKIIREQRENRPDELEIIKSIKELPLGHISEYLGFLEHKYGIGLAKDAAKVIFIKAGITDESFIESYAADLDSQALERLTRLVYAKSDQLFDAYLYIAFPEQMINDFVLMKANGINEQYKGHFQNTLDLIKIAIELNKGPNPEELFASFKGLKKEYLESNFPSVDISTFYRLTIPILKRCSIRRGPDGFYEMRDRIIQELISDGLNPEQLSIAMLDRRNKHRIAPMSVDTPGGYTLH